MEDGKLFYVGQQVTPLNKPQWIERATNKPKDGPKFGGIYKVNRHQLDEETGRWFIAFDEFGESELFPEELFAPVLGDSDLAELMQEVGVAV